jgi:hypothetical protein
MTAAWILGVWVSAFAVSGALASQVRLLVIRQFAPAGASAGG